MQRKKTALRAHRKVSAPTQESGLIVAAKNAGRSARTTRAVDNRSHRTPKFTCKGIQKLRAQRATKAPLTSATIVRCQLGTMD
jgi:hypothetical protein